MVVNLSQSETERGRDHEGPLAKVWQKLLHQVKKKKDHQRDCVFILFDHIYCIIIGL